MVKKEHTNFFFFFNKRYDLGDKLNLIPRRIYVNNIILHVNTNKELQFMFNEVMNFFEFVRLQIIFDTKNKSIYTNNTFAVEKLYIDKKNQYNNFIKKYLPYYSKEESYKYLEV